MLTAEDIKKKVGIYAASFVQQGMTIGLGTGTTAYWLIQELGKMIQQGLEITAVPTSVQTAKLAQEAGIRLTDLNTISRLPLTIDGADEIDPHGQLIKGGGGALLQEKIVAKASDKMIVIADSGKLVPQLGKFPLPVEVIPLGYKQVEQAILRTGDCGKVALRQKNGQPFITDHHHYILDCEYGKIADASLLNSTLHQVPGVVETGLFIKMATKAVIGYEDGRIEVIRYRN